MDINDLGWSGTDPPEVYESYKVYFWIPKTVIKIIFSDQLQIELSEETYLI